MNKSDQIDKLAAALVKAQPMIEIAHKSSVNPHFRNKYADLASIWDACGSALQENQLAVSQLTDEINGQPALTTMLIHESGQWISATYPLISVKADPQGFASATTYARRYGLASLLGILADDDDGEAASRPAKAPAAKPAPEPKPDPVPKPTNAAADWVSAREVELRNIRTKADMATWCKKNAAALDKLLTTDKALYNAINLKIALRNDELEAMAAA